MGLKLTLPKENNFLYCDFVDAYWCIENTTYDVNGSILFELNVYPSREAKYKDLSTDIQSIGVGGSYRPVFETKLYEWQGVASTAELFPDGIPLSKNLQLTAIYNWVKAYTGLPFEDVLETEAED